MWTCDEQGVQDEEEEDRYEEGFGAEEGAPERAWEEPSEHGGGGDEVRGVRGKERAMSCEREAEVEIGEPEDLKWLFGRSDDGAEVSGEVSDAERGENECEERSESEAWLKIFTSLAGGLSNTTLGVLRLCILIGQEIAGGGTEVM